MKLLFIALICLSCSNISSPNKPIVGKFDANGLETGYWEYRDSLNRPYATGNFREGVRLGKWKYFGSQNDSIFWHKFKSDSLSLITNIPDFVHLTDQNKEFARFKSIDSSRIFTLVIGKMGALSFSDYQKMTLNDLSTRNVSIVDSQTTHQTTNQGKEYLYTRIYGRIGNGEIFDLQNIIGHTSKGNLVELSLRCDAASSKIGDKVFFSIFPNLFIDSERFLVPSEKIISFLQPERKY